MSVKAGDGVDSQELRRILAARLDEKLQGRKATAVAHAAGISESRLSSWRNGRRLPELVAFRALVIELGASADWMLAIPAPAGVIDLERVQEQAARETADRALHLFASRLQRAIRVLPTDLRADFQDEFTNDLEGGREVDDEPEARESSG